MVRLTCKSNECRRCALALQFSGDGAVVLIEVKEAPPARAEAQRSAIDLFHKSIADGPRLLVADRRTGAVIPAEHAGGSAAFDQLGQVSAEAALAVGSGATDDLA